MVCGTLNWVLQTLPHLHPHLHHRSAAWSGLNKTPNLKTLSQAGWNWATLQSMLQVISTKASSAWKSLMMASASAQCGKAVLPKAAAAKPSQARVVWVSKSALLYCANPAAGAEAADADITASVTQKLWTKKRPALGGSNIQRRLFLFRKYLTVVSSFAVRSNVQAFAFVFFRHTQTDHQINQFVRNHRNDA
jgi:hypothetical protein